MKTRILVSYSNISGPTYFPQKKTFFGWKFFYKSVWTGMDLCDIEISFGEIEAAKKYLDDFHKWNLPDAYIPYPN